MTRFIPSVLVLSACFLVPEAGATQFGYLTQDRSLVINVLANDAGGNPLTDGNTIVAPDFCAFQAMDTVSITAALGSASASGSHSSSLLPDRMSFAASANASASAPSLVSGAGAQGGVISNFAVTFELLSPTFCSLNGQFTSSGTGSSPGIFLNGPGGLVWADDGPPDSSQVPTQFSGILVPGIYTLSATAFGSEAANKFSQFGGNSSLDFEFVAVDPVGSNGCVSTPNSTGTAATIGALGSAMSSEQTLTLFAEGLVPSTFGLFFFGPNQANQPLGGGILCVGGSLTRLHRAEPASTSGLFLHSVDFSPGTPADQLLQAGSTWVFQFWYRDSGDPLGSNTSDSLAISFQ